MGRFQRHKTDDKDLGFVQDNVEAALQPLLANPLASDGHLITGQLIAISPTYTMVGHGLNRPLRGWIPVRVRGSATLWDDQDNNAASTQTLKLTASAAVTVDLYVF